MKTIFPGQNLCSGAFGGQHLSLHKTKGPARKPISGSPPPPSPGAHAIPPPAKQFSGRQKLDCTWLKFSHLHWASVVKYAHQVLTDRTTLPVTPSTLALCAPATCCGPVCTFVLSVLSCPCLALLSAPSVLVKLPTGTMQTMQLNGCAFAVPQLSYWCLLLSYCSPQCSPQNAHSGRQVT